MTEEKTGTATAVRLLMTMSALFLLGGALPVNAAPDCRGRLHFDEVYECEFVSDQSALEVDGTLLFEEFDGNAFQATLDLLDETTVAYCTCKTRPPDRFNRAKYFECVTGFDNSAGETFEAKVNGNGNKINKGQLWSSDPLESGFGRFIFDCTHADDSDSDSDSDSEQERVVLCHNGSITLEVSDSAVPDHLAHGDTLGSCGSD